jgi:hypothetical protein
MSDNWPGRWHSKTPEPSKTNDNGLLLLTGDGAEEYLWYESDGHDWRAELGR